MRRVGPGLIGSALLMAGVANAHGPTPAVVASVGLGDHAPWLVQLSAGYAVQSADDSSVYEYLCPSALGLSLASGRAIALDESTALVAGAEDVFVVRPQGLAPLKGGPAGSAVISWRRAGDGTVIALIAGASRELWSLTGQGATRIVDLPAPYTGLNVFQGDIVLALAEPNGARIARVAFADASNEYAWEGSDIDLGEADGRTAALALSDGRLALWLRDVDIAFGYWLPDVPEGPVEPFGMFGMPAYGPVTLGGAPHVLDGAGFLHQLASSAGPSSTGLTCLGGTGDAVWACEFDELVTLENDGGIGDSLFELSQLRRVWAPSGGGRRRAATTMRVGAARLCGARRYRG